MGSEWEWITEDGRQHLVEIKHYGYTIDLFQSIKVIYIHCCLANEL